MQTLVKPVELSLCGVRLEPLGSQHRDGLAAAVQDGKLWELIVTSAPSPEQVQDYIDTALMMSNRFAFAVIDETTGKVLGSTSYHDIIDGIKRVEIGYTWYAKSAQKTHVNTACKVMLLTHAFETLGCPVVGWRTDILNINSQRAIERLGAKKDGILRHHALRKDGSVRDTVAYSMLADEWQLHKPRLMARLNRDAQYDQSHGVGKLA
ncbi:GNAT family N-acetyltransferase [Moraxella sp. ZJ142]|uniref:GNAT family N-acetyltransferase n=1 Tax=Moraxella marmotae TaxID=3344520 RepID=UPI0035D4E9E2